MCVPACFCDVISNIRKIRCRKRFLVSCQFRDDIYCTRKFYRSNCMWRSCHKRCCQFYGHAVLLPLINDFRQMRSLHWRSYSAVDCSENIGSLGKIKLIRIMDLYFMFSGDVRNVRRNARLTLFVFICLHNVFILMFLHICLSIIQH